MSDNMELSEVFSALAAVSMTMGTVILGMASFLVNDSVTNRRVSELKAAATIACAVRSADDPNAAASVEADCLSAASSAADEVKPALDSRTFLIFADKKGNERYSAALATIRDNLPAQARSILAARIVADKEKQRTEKLLGQVNEAITAKIQGIVIGNERPFAKANIRTDFQSVIPVTGADGKERHEFTGKFAVTVTDPGSNASRLFAYDHATQNVTQTMGETNGTYSFHMDFGFVGRSPSESSYGYGSGDGGGAVHMESNGPVNCGGQRRAACAIISAIHRVLNGLSLAQLTTLRTSIAGDTTARQKYAEAYAYPAFRL